MIDLKSHNDLVQKLMADNDRLEAELKELSLRLRKAQAGKEIQGLKDRELGRKTKDDTVKLQRMQKQFKDKIDQMNKIVLARDLQITELKERLDTKLNIDEREKEHLIDTFRKWQGRKPNSSNDYKVMSVINHYENQLERLSKQLEQQRGDSTHYQELTRTLKKKLLDKENQDINIEGVEQQVEFAKSEMEGKVASLEIDRLNKELQRKSKKTELVEKECGELRNRYEELLKEYYRMVNEYGELNKPAPSASRPQKSTQRTAVPVKHSPIVETVIKKCTQEEEGVQSSLCYSQTSQAAKLEKSTNQAPSVASFNEEENAQLGLYRQIISRVMEIHKLDDPNNVVAACIKLDLAVKNLPKMEACLGAIKDMLERVLQRKVNMARLTQTLAEVEKLIGQARKKSQLVRSIEMKVGSDSTGLVAALQRIMKENEEYYSSLKTIGYVKSLELSRQIQQFIQFFELDPSSPLPQQIMNLYKQLKSVNTFVQICNRILETEYPVAECLEHVMKLLERTKMGADKRPK